MTATGVLIEVGELAARIAGAEPLVLADVRWTLAGPSARPDFEQAHLIGAQWVDLDAELSSPPGAGGGRHPLPDPDVFTAAMRRIGVSPETDVVVYDGANSLPAARLWWLLTDAGHERVRVLNGGLVAWTSAGQPTQTGPEEPVAAGTFTARPGHRTQLDGQAIAARLDQPAAPTLVDVRAAERYSGATEPMDPAAGHIPGALNRPSMDHVDIRGRFLGADQLAAQYADLDEPVFYCGSGITAAHSLLAWEAAGRSGGAIYPGSWSDWITDRSRPVVTGD